MRTKVKQVLSRARGKGQGKGKQTGRYRDDIEAQRASAEDAAEAERWEQEEQQTLMRRQDDTLGVISGTLSTLASQAGLIGNEVQEHSV
jgi:syntaxin 6